MRNRLIGWLDDIGIQKSLGIQSSTLLFDILGQDALHSTSVLRYPAFINKKKLGHSPKILKVPYFKKHVENIFVPEIRYFSNSLIIPLGSAVQSVLITLKKIEKAFKFLLNGFPHPSPLNVGSNNILKKNKVNFIKTVKKFF